MIYIEFLILAAVVVWGASRLSKNAEQIESNSKINVVFVGIILALTTSLPELATGVTSAFIGQSTMAVSNVLGSNVFNLMIIAIMNIYFFKKLVYSNVKKESNKINYFSLIMYAVFLLALFTANSGIFQVGRVNILSITIVIIYFVSLKLIKPEEDPTATTEHHDKKKLNNSIVKFIVYAVIILFASMFLSVIAEKIMLVSGLEASFVGATFIGVSTSLPEFTGAFTLCAMKKYDLAVVSVIGSNLFNFIIFGIVDVIDKEPLFVMESDLVLLAMYGIVMTLLTVLALKLKLKSPRKNIIIPIVIVVLYLSYIVSGLV